MIILYEMTWSHYCEKIRLALNFTGLPWKAVSVSPFSMSEMHSYGFPAYLPTYTVPAIYDNATDTFVMDSTPILRHLASAYPDRPSLFPGDEKNRAAIDSKLLELDTALGLLARRLGYTQAILECPGHLTTLFLGNRAFGFFRLPGVHRISGWVLGMVLMKRFDMHQSESLGVYEALEAYLLPIAKRLTANKYLVGDAFSAADLSLAALLRPLTIVPFFAEHPDLRDLFDWHRSVVASCGEEAPSAYQCAIRQARTKRPPVRRKIRTMTSTIPFALHGSHAHNDQRTVWTWSFAMAPFQYMFGIRANKVRSAYASEYVR